MATAAMLWAVLRFLLIAVWTVVLHTVEEALDRWVAGSFKRGHRSLAWRVLHRVGRFLRHLWHRMPGQAGILIPPPGMGGPCSGCPGGK